MSERLIFWWLFFVTIMATNYVGQPFTAWWWVGGLFYLISSFGVTACMGVAIWRMWNRL